MAYVTEIEIKDLESGIRNVQSELLNLAFDAHHEANYGMGRILSMEECTKLGERYDKGVGHCTNYLDGDLSIYELAIELKELNLLNFLMRVKKYLPQNVLDLSPTLEDSDATDIEEDDFNEEERSLSPVLF